MFCCAGNNAKTSKYDVVQQPTESEPAHPGDSEPLQCSVLSDSDSKTCSEDLSVFWFRTNAENSHPDVLHIETNRRARCENGSDVQRSCFYNLLNKSSSNEANYHCAVATCGQMLFDHGTKDENGKIL